MTQIDHVALTVQDLPGMARFYETTLGLEPMGGDGARRDLGAGGQVLIRLLGDAAALPRDPRDAGLFHTAFLLPDRPALARWLRHAAGSGVRLSGASDHGVSEALYLDDPEGNGIEIYVDRPASDWTRNGDRIEMFTARLDLDALAHAADGPWQGGAPHGTRIGHVHLQVAEMDPADTFMRDTLGLTRTFDAPGGAWFGWDGYHHHLAANVWNSRGAGPRPQGRAGLAYVAVQQQFAPHEEIVDPSGNVFRFV